jgi:hypothetical protein
MIKDILFVIGVVVVYGLFKIIQAFNVEVTEKLRMRLFKLLDYAQLR